MRLPRLPVPVAPARHETLTSYLGRLADLHGMSARELWEPISTPRKGTARRDIVADRLVAITGRHRDNLARALPELRDPAPDWTTWRHQPQPRCPRCDARHEGGQVTRLLPHHRYVCTRHRYWIGPPDAGQVARQLGDGLDDIVRAQRQHIQLLRRHGSAATFDAVLTGFMICGHLWSGQPQSSDDAAHQWVRRAQILIPPGSESSEFSASRLFAAVYPEAVSLAHLLASPTWRGQAGGNTEQQQRFRTEIGRRLGRPQPQTEGSDVITHWMKFDSWQPPSRPDKTFPQTREYGAIRPATPNAASRERHHRSAIWFSLNRRGGSVILHHRHIRPVLVRDWSPKMDGITATLWASQTTTDHYRSTLSGFGETAPAPPSSDDREPQAAETAVLN